MKRHSKVFIVVNPSGIVRLSDQDGSVLYEAMADNIKVETENVITRVDTEVTYKAPSRKDSWVINSLFSTTLSDGTLGIFKCQEYDICHGFLMIGISENCKDSRRYCGELGICREWQPTYDEEKCWMTKPYAKCAASDPYVVIPKD